MHVVNQRRYSYAFFVQDDWRANDRLTLNLGLRYDFMTPSYEADDRMANFDPESGQLVFASDGSLEDRTLVAPDRNNFGPRLGIVYQLNEQTVLRGGYGIFYNFLDRIGSEDQLALNPPGLRNNNITASASATTPVLILREGFPANYLDPSNIVLSRLLIRAANPSGENALNHQIAARRRETDRTRVRRLCRPRRQLRPQPRRPAQPQSALERQRPAAVSRISHTSSGAIRSAIRATTVSTCRQRSDSARA